MIAKLLPVFKAVDADRNNRIDVDEACTLINKVLGLKWSKELVKKYIFLVSSDGQPLLGFDEFVRFIQCVEAKEDPDQSLQDILFFAADLNCNGLIDLKEFIIICEKMEYAAKLGRDTIMALAVKAVGSNEISRANFKIILKAIDDLIDEKGL